MKTKYIKRKGMLLSSVAMLGTAMLLTACGGDGGDSPVDDFGSNPGEGDNQALLYAYPDNGQEEISTAAPVVLRFSSAVNLGEAQNSITVYEGDAQSGTVVAVTPESVAGEPNNVLLQPDEDLKPNQTYTVVIEDLRLRKGVAKDQTLTFTTRPLHEGPKNLVVKEDTFEISRRMPDGSAMEPVMDFSSFRFQFTQPIDRATATYGDGNTVVLRDSAGDPVDATLLIDGAYMTVDPDAEYLNAGETYTLDITADLTSTYGETFGTESYTFTPKDSSPGREPAILVQKLTQGTTSRLTGKPVNEVPVNGTLLGENDNITQASAEVVRAELADVTTYTDVTPIRLPKGTVLNGAEINPILIGGEVPAGFGSGDVTMTVLSDASGYLVPNPYAENNPDALRIVHLLMDVGIATSEPRANGAFTQDLLHIELVGLAEVDPDAGVLNLDAVSVVEPNILGQEYGYGMLSFQLQSYKDQNNPPQVVEDTTAPTLQSWIPGENPSLYKLGDPIVLNFDEPLDPSSVQGKISLYENQAPIDISYHVDGSAVVIEPTVDLHHSTASVPYEYELQLADGISDLHGNIYTPDTLSAFEFPLIVESRKPSPLIIPGAPDEPAEQRAPIALSVYPGFPCALTETDLMNDDVGRCVGSFPGHNQGTQYDVKSEDDHLPLMELPANRPIVVQFSKLIDPASVQLGQSFVVQEINVNQAAIGSVDGHVEVAGKTLKFTPDEPWKLGTLYQYTLKSNGNSASSSAVCDGTGAICDLSGLPLQTDVFPNLQIEPVSSPTGQPIPPNSERDYKFLTTAKAPGSGGPDMVQPFRGGEASNAVLQILRSKPAYDANANFQHEVDEELSINFAAGLVPQLATFYYVYPNGKERDATDQPLDPNADTSLDPGGLLPPSNSAKLLSRDKTGSPPPALQFNGVSVGCGYQNLEFWDPNNPDPQAQYPIAYECPEKKFTYLTSALAAEITDEYIDGKGLKALIWPSQIMSTSLLIFQHIQTGPGVVPTKSGAQMLRMRYAEEPTSGLRNQPITAWIVSGPDGKPVLNAEVDLYMDALALSENIPSIQTVHNIISFPVTMHLEGEITFLSDGRMAVEQFNTNVVDLDFVLHNPEGTRAGNLPLRIPAYGNRLQYISESIK